MPSLETPPNLEQLSLADSQIPGIESVVEKYYGPKWEGIEDFRPTEEPITENGLLVSDAAREVLDDELRYYLRSQEYSPLLKGDRPQELGVIGETVDSTALHIAEHMRRPDSKRAETARQAISQFTHLGRDATTYFALNKLKTDGPKATQQMIRDFALGSFSLTEGSLNQQLRESSLKTRVADRVANSGKFGRLVAFGSATTAGLMASGQIDKAKELLETVPNKPLIVGGAVGAVAMKAFLGRQISHVKETLRDRRVPTDDKTRQLKEHHENVIAKGNLSERRAEALRQEIRSTGDLDELRSAVGNIFFESPDFYNAEENVVSIDRLGDLIDKVFDFQEQFMLEKYDLTEAAVATKRRTRAGYYIGKILGEFTGPAGGVVEELIDNGLEETNPNAS